MRLSQKFLAWHRRQALLALLYFLWSAPTILAQCLEGNCQNGQGIFRYDDGKRYSGAFNKGEPTGEGALYYPNGERYLGQFRNGRPHGQGIYWYPDGSFRKGRWQAGSLQSSEAHRSPLQERGARGYGCVNGNCENGFGTYVSAGGAVYVGQFRNGEIHGQGICTYGDGSRYEGQWAHRYPEGFGTKRWADGREYSGQWRRGQPATNDGVFLYPNRPITAADGGFVPQSGCLNGDCNNGQGVYAYADGSRYEGSFLQGQPHGNGIFYYPNGDRYDGEFAYGLPHGSGKRSYANGQILRGDWVEGGYLKPTTAETRKGCLQGDCNNGFGIYRFQQGDRYEGTFVNGKPEGHGIVLYQNGDRYEGEMQEGAFTGFGTYYEQTGAIFEGSWSGGKYLGNTRKHNTNSGNTIATAPLEGPKTWALIIGVSSYRHMPALRFPDDDAYRLFAFLKSPQGGAVPDERMQILIDEDATLKNIMHAMEGLFLRAGPEDLVILYFSGHGLPGAFLPIDYDGVSNTLTHQEIKRMLDMSPAGYKLCLADACHSGGLLSTRGGQLPSVLSRYYENLSQTRPGTALIMSSKAEETSLESSGLRQGVFSHFLLRGLKGEADQDRDNVVRVQELYQYVSQQVNAYTRHAQSPVIQGDYDQQMPVAVLR
ncbi:MAG: caspase family protein [Bacteroidota bacterium]